MSMLDLAVDRASEVPLGTQLIWRLRTLIATGVLSPGDRLPGIRDVAETAGVNVNTVRSVFARLEDQGLLRSEHGRGTFVAPNVQTTTILAEMAQSAIEQAEQAGLDPRELAAALYVTPKGSSGVEQDELDEREARRAIRAEIVQLEREVAALDPVGTLDVAPSRATPRLLKAREIRHTRDALRARLHELRREREEWRLENEQLEREERAADQAERARATRGLRWREAGIWTGHPGARVSWTSPGN